MAVSRKNKRPIRVGGQGYLWWVASDDPLLSGSLCLSLAVVSESGDFFIRYFLGQPEDVRHVEVIGRRFRSIAGCGSVHRRFLCPAVENEACITPSDVAALIAWATLPSNDVVEVNYMGTPIAANGEA